MGLPKMGHVERQDVFSLAKDYRVIKFARPSITAFAAQIVEEHLINSVKKAVSVSGGLHTFTTGAQNIEQDNYGAETVEKASAAIQRNLPLFWNYVIGMATPHHRNRRSRAKGALLETSPASRNERPPEIVTVYAISSICFSRNRNAKLLAQDNGLLLFACGANRYLFSHESRNGSSTSYHATTDSLVKYAEHSAGIVRHIGRSTVRVLLLRLDNIQKQKRVRDQRMGRENHMLIGTAGTACEGEGYEEGILDIDQKTEWISKGLRRELTFTKLWYMVDHSYVNEAMPIHWLEILIEFVPELEAAYATEVQTLYTTHSIKQQVPPRVTKIFPLSTNGYNETSTTEMKKALEDFLKQLGQTQESYNRRLILTGGDGLTYERMVQLKNYLQFQSNAYERMDIVEPFLEIWHTVWTFLSRIYEAHWVGLRSRDPSSLGYGATVLKRKAPGNVSKVDYYPYADLLNTQLSARILDIWRNTFETEDLFQYFEQLKENKNLPSLQQLYAMAQALHKRYGTRKAFEHALSGDDSLTFYRGSAWSAPKQDESSKSLGQLMNAKLKKGKKKENKPQESEPFAGDESLARSTRFIHDALLFRHVLKSVSKGDIGGTWECLKTMLFSFAGSSHTKYTAYLLEMVFESSPKLRKFFFENWLVSTSGRSFEAGDLFQERCQDELYEHINSRDTGFDEQYVRKMISPNVYRFMKVKKDIHESLGLARRSGNHITPSDTADVRKLIGLYQSEELHLFRFGRTYTEADRRRVDDFGRGVSSLQNGRLAKWVQETCRVRCLNKRKEEPINLETQTFDEPCAEFDNANSDSMLEHDGFALNPNDDIGQKNTGLEKCLEGTGNTECDEKQGEESDEEQGELILGSLENTYDDDFAAAD
ncbi:hypothetical protein K435DRAFT_824491 [Dendrothele bispora CBS 962.96]|uniref:DUF6589 domain-containing protein n=1 Tax=Dendrothele bispora (strain CBS 962.96) TaxID=1314807 RepID=A0A4S8KNL3_DENBC|nr:hypothetical protein K435DRAFT_824491 [Dendrothele bispora CBS 962.96]